MTMPFDVRAAKAIWETEYESTAVGNGREHAEGLITQLFVEIERLREHAHVVTDADIDRNYAELIDLVDNGLLEAYAAGNDCKAAPIFKGHERFGRLLRAALYDAAMQGERKMEARMLASLAEFMRKHARSE